MTWPCLFYKRLFLPKLKWKHNIFVSRSWTFWKIELDDTAAFDSKSIQAVLLTSAGIHRPTTAELLFWANNRRLRLFQLTTRHRWVEEFLKRAKEKLPYMCTLSSWLNVGRHSILGGLHRRGTLSYICANLSPKAVLGIRGGWTLGDC